MKDYPAPIIPVEPAIGVRVRFRVSYVGTGFSGWQIQPDRRTVQGELRQQLSFLMGREVTPVGAGRTDTGVHSHGQVAHVTVVNQNEALRIEKALAGLMPDDIEISEVQQVPMEFHSRFSAIARRYSYHLRFVRDIFSPNSWLVNRPLDRQAMDQAAAHFLGSHDCSSFCKTASLKEKGNTCHIGLCSFEWGEDSAIFHVQANRFLHHMVRIMVGTLVEVGRGHHRPDDIVTIIEAQDRSEAGLMAPAEGLFLEEVYYPNETPDHSRDNPPEGDGS